MFCSVSFTENGLKVCSWTRTRLIDAFSLFPYQSPPLSVPCAFDEEVAICRDLLVVHCPWQCLCQTAFLSFQISPRLSRYHGTRRRGRPIPSQQPGTVACKLEYDYEESTRSDCENFGNRNARNRTRDGVSDDPREEITMGGPLYACGNGESSSEESKSVWTVNKHGTQRKGRPIPWQQPGTAACKVGGYDHDESTCSDFENFGDRIARNRAHHTVEAGGRGRL